MVRFLNEDIGWLKANDDFLSSDSAYIFKTTDAGATWLPSEVWLGTSYGALFVLDELRVVYSRTVINDSERDELRLTTDGGASWSTVDTVADGFYEDIDFIDDQTGFVVGGFDCVFSGCDGFIKKTTDGGSSWSVVFVLEDFDFTGVSFVTTLEGWASVYWNQLYSTHDGGLTWARDTSYAPPNTPTRDVMFTSPDSGWAVGGISGNLTISRTTDGGVSWLYYESLL